MNNNENVIIIQRVKELMNQKNLNQTELSKMSDINKVTLSSYLRGERNVSNQSLELLSKALNVSIDYLRGKTEIKTDNYDIKKISEYTGIDEDIIFFLHKNKDFSNILNETLNIKQLGATLLHDLSVFYKLFFNQNDFYEFNNYEVDNLTINLYKNDIENILLQRINSDLKNIKCFTKSYENNLRLKIHELKEYVEQLSDKETISEDEEIYIGEIEDVINSLEDEIQRFENITENKNKIASTYWESRCKIK